MFINNHSLNQVVIGLDPGGLNKFGWACLRNDFGKFVLNTGCSDNARAAIREANNYTEGFAPVAVGIDSPLFWVAEGDRRADASLRRRVCAADGHSGTVGHVNSLRGACLVQGVLAARQVAEKWPSVKITEAHPKALRLVHFKDDPLEDDQLKKFVKDHLSKLPTEHERDAALAAYTAWAFAEKSDGWSDLALEEVEPFFPSGGKVSYWFPTP